MNAALDVKTRMTEERWEAMTFWPLLVGSLAFLASYSWRVISDLDGSGEAAALGIMIIIWLLANSLDKSSLLPKRLHPHPCAS